MPKDLRSYLDDVKEERVDVRREVDPLTNVGAVFSRWMLLMALSGLGLAACAPEIVRRPTQLTPMTEQPGGTIEIVENASISVGPGYQRVIGRGSVWTRIGRSAG